jgi:hypothetical protein
MMKGERQLVLTIIMLKIPRDLCSALILRLIPYAHNNNMKICVTVD